MKILKKPAVVMISDYLDHTVIAFSSTLSFKREEEKEKAESKFDEEVQIEDLILFWNPEKMKLSKEDINSITSRLIFKHNDKKDVTLVTLPDEDINIPKDIIIKKLADTWPFIFFLRKGERIRLFRDYRDLIDLVKFLNSKK